MARLEICPIDIWWSRKRKEESTVSQPLADAEPLQLMFPSDPTLFPADAPDMEKPPPARTMFVCPRPAPSTSTAFPFMDTSTDHVAVQAGREITSPSAALLMAA